MFLVATGQYFATRIKYVKDIGDRLASFDCSSTEKATHQTSGLIDVKEYQQLTGALLVVDGTARGRIHCKPLIRPCGRGCPDMIQLALPVGDTEAHFGPGRNMATGSGER